jgi:DNA-binding CsgD family transcriptional regulator
MFAVERTHSVECADSYIRLALNNMLDELAVENVNVAHLRILVIAEKDPVEGLARFCRVNPERYDLILCPQFYYALIQHFFTKWRLRFVCLDSEYALMKKNIRRIVTHEFEPKVIPWPGLRFTPGELELIHYHIKQLCAKQIARIENCSIKAVSNRKRQVMAKMHCHTNAQFWLTLKFLLHFDHASLRSLNSRTDENISHYAVPGRSVSSAITGNRYA